MRPSAATVVDASQPRGLLDGTPLLTRARLWTTIGAASALAMFLLSHPYWGVVHDAELYVGQAVANADPGGLGRDIFFALEGQSAFSIYPTLSGAFLRRAGPGTGALILTLGGLCLW